MSISKISFGNNTVQTTQNNRPKPQIPITQNNTTNSQVQTIQKEPFKTTPLKAGLLLGSVCFGCGFAGERIVNSMFKLKQSPKNSIIVNAGIGFVMGALAYIGTKTEARKTQQIEQTQQID